MEVIVLDGADDVARVAAGIIAEVFRGAPSGVFGLATGSSPLAIYSELACLFDQVDLDLTRIPGFALDEYVGIPIGRPESYTAVLQRVVTEPSRMDTRRVHVPDGRADDLDAACESYEEAIREAGGVDLQLLGIGRNGHIGFNEPTSSFASRTRAKTLAPQTRADNARFFASPKEVTVHCLTQGFGTILEARQLLLVATGI
ncbi:glucosamine-6-phosphate deaminase [Luethyella okanaganae]|uniref:Glucosamine-6-phosphate deaminase n=1 Tax=Luethyella okanaganae TaxID=69372 RepID=A0ABW1VJ84_9MICO